MSHKAGSEDQYYKKLSNGEFSFDSHGRPMVVRRPKPEKYPELLSETGIGVDGVLVKEAKVSYVESTIEEAGTQKSQASQISTKRPQTAVKSTTESDSKKKTQS